MENTKQQVNWSVAQLVPNTEGILVGRQRKPRPFRTIEHPAESCADAFAKAEQLGMSEGKAGVRANGESIVRWRDGWEEYRQLVLKNTGHDLGPQL